MRVINNVITTCPEGKEDKYRSNKYFVGHIVYLENTNAFIIGKNNTIGVIGLTDDFSQYLDVFNGTIKEFIDFIEVCIQRMPHIVPITIFNTLLYIYNQAE